MVVPLFVQTIEIQVAVSAQEVLTHIKSNNYAPIYFLQGEETYFIDQISDYIEANALTEAEKGFNQTIMYGKDCKMNEILTNARRFPMMAEKQVVIVKEAQEVDDLKKSGGQKLLEHYLQSPVPSTILVFAHKYKSLDKRTSLYKLLEKSAVTVSTKKMYDNQVPAWVKTLVASKGHKVDDQAAQLLADYIGNDLERLANEVDKMAINLKEPSLIDAKMVQTNVGINKDYNVFEFQNALLRMDVVKANQIVNYFESNPKKHPVIPVIALVYGLFSKLLVVHGSSDKSEKSLASKLKVSPYFVKDYILGARNYPFSQVISNLKSLRKADMQSKGIDSPAINDGDILRELTFRLMHPVMVQ